MDDLITTNDTLQDALKRLRRFLSLKGVSHDYKIELSYRGNKLSEIELWVYNHFVSKRDDSEKFALMEKIRRRLQLAGTIEENYSHLKAEYDKYGIKVRFQIYI
jgi:hypothetical protein